MSSIDKKQKLLLEYILSNDELFIKCFRIALPEYFEPPLDRVVLFCKEYFQSKHAIPDFDIIDAELDIQLKEREVDRDEFTYVLEEFETHCRDAAMSNVILESVDCLERGESSAIQEMVRDALMIRIDNRLGTSIFEDPVKRIEEMDDNIDLRSSGYKGFDDLVGQLARGELGIFAAPTSGGKSLFLANFAAKLASTGLDCVIVSIEMDEDRYGQRLDTIVTGYPLKDHKTHPKEVALKLQEVEETYGDILVKRVNRKFNVSDLRTFLKEYELQRGKAPDVLMLDYIDIMGVEPHMTKSTNKFDIDEYKSQELRDMCFEFNMYGFTAAQLNRDGYDILKVGPHHIAGGLSKVNASDWTVAVIQTEEDMENNQFQLRQMKIRNNEKDPKPITMYLNTRNLQLSDTPWYNKTSHTPSSPNIGKGKSKLQQAIGMKNGKMK